MSHVSISDKEDELHQRSLENTDYPNDRQEEEEKEEEDGEGKRARLIIDNPCVCSLLSMRLS